MFPNSFYAYDLSLLTTSLNLTAIGLQEIIMLVAVAVTSGFVLFGYRFVFPYLYYRSILLAEWEAKQKKLQLASTFILKKEIQAELEAEMKEELAREIHGSNPMAQF